MTLNPSLGHSVTDNSGYKMRIQENWDWTMTEKSFLMHLIKIINSFHFSCHNLENNMKAKERHLKFYFIAESKEKMEKIYLYSIQCTLYNCSRTYR